MDPKLIELGFQVTSQQNHIKELEETIEKLKESRQISKTTEKDTKAKLIELESENYKLRNDNLRLENEKNVAKRALKTVEERFSKSQEKNKEIDRERKQLKALDPARLKKNVQKLKDKISESQEVKGRYESRIKILEEEYEKMRYSIKALMREVDMFYLSEDKKWGLRLTQFKFPDEKGKKNIMMRIRCLNLETGTSVIAVAHDEQHNVHWSDDIGVPDEVSKEAVTNMISLKENGKLQDDYMEVVAGRTSLRTA